MIYNRFTAYISPSIDFVFSFDFIHIIIRIKIAHFRIKIRRDDDVQCSCDNSGFIVKSDPPWASDYS